jgi:hypothetical protein
LLEERVESMAVGEDFNDAADSVAVKRSSTAPFRQPAGAA